ncbi:MAG TPA: 30S ribosomal protein S8 [Chloroflexi bacterium]|nr:MAG: 30S ribosomal protein S8 [Chloroflexota bacterium]HDD55759.1 30S ribosomal protein S8 [Chloroflexota bacterium]
MSFNDPIADMLTRIRNAVRAEHPQVSMPSSKMKVAIAKILVEEGFISGYEVTEEKDAPHKTLTLGLKYVGNRRTKRSVITNLERVSLPSQRIYAGKDEIPYVLSGMGISILTTSRGVMTGRDAKKLGVGGEVVCKVW